MADILKMPKLHLATSKDCMRPSLGGVLIEDNAGIATDAHLLVKVSLENVILDNILELMNGMLLPAKMWAHFCSAKYPVFTVEDNKVFFRGPFGDLRVRGMDERFPEYKNAVDYWQPNSVDVIAFNPKYLEIINKVFENPQAGLRIDFSAANKPVRVVPNEPDHSPWKCEAFLMPQMLSNCERDAPFAFFKSGAVEAGRNEGEK
jgi:hypothetical protein